MSLYNELCINDSRKHRLSYSAFNEVCIRLGWFCLVPRIMAPKICSERWSFIRWLVNFICSQMKPKVVIEAFFILRSSCWQLLASESIIFCHYPRGNSIVAIAAIIMAPDLITSACGLIRTLSTFYLMSSFWFEFTSSQLYFPLLGFYNIKVITFISKRRLTTVPASWRELVSLLSSSRMMTQLRKN